ncbi:MAG: DNA-processing protein DprA [Thermoanaerobaculum sp.]|nr:DNA-processing protein DprA [Thermoanaerobaculum sp.]MDW7967912.1 DNA-processing protein DprA [Thermoanaerobaculum sp.]
MAVDDSFRTLCWALIAHGRAGRGQARQRLAQDELPPEDLQERARRALAAAAREGFHWVPASDPSFPEGLRALSDPPLGLFVKGRWPQGPAVAIVGSRRASAYGKEVGHYLGKELAQAGVWVVSGMARGVDAAAHQGALAAGGMTAAVWGSGCDRVYPPEHQNLARAIAQTGALLTEYPPGTPPRAIHFPERNRLIVGLARVVVVVEADARSGALVSARLALEEGREVMAVPGSIFAPLSVGPNGLLRAGAAPVLSAQDVLDLLGVTSASTPPPQEGPELGLLRFLPHGQALSVDELVARSGRSAQELLPELTSLELDGRVRKEQDGRYRRL